MAKHRKKSDERMSSNCKNVSLNVLKPYLDMIDILEKKGLVASRSEAMRNALSEYILKMFGLVKYISQNDEIEAYAEMKRFCAEEMAKNKDNADKKKNGRLTFADMRSEVKDTAIEETKKKLGITDE